jgi:hypothetical protein
LLDRDGLRERISAAVPPFPTNGCGDEQRCGDAEDGRPERKTFASTLDAPDLLPALCELGFSICGRGRPAGFVQQLIQRIVAVRSRRAFRFDVHISVREDLVVEKT